MNRHPSFACAPVAQSTDRTILINCATECIFSTPATRVQFSINALPPALLRTSNIPVHINSLHFMQAQKAAVLWIDCTTTAQVCPSTRRADLAWWWPPSLRAFWGGIRAWVSRIENALVAESTYLHINRAYNTNVESRCAAGQKYGCLTDRWHASIGVGLHNVCITFTGNARCHASENRMNVRMEILC